MWSAIITKSMISENYYFILHDESAGMIFQSGEWETEKACLNGVWLFRQLVQAGSYEEVRIKRKGNSYFREYRDRDNKVWGYGTQQNSENGCNKEYETLKNAMKASGRIVNQKEVLPIDPKIMDFLFSLDGCGFDENGQAAATNPAQVKQWENPEFMLWNNDIVREKFFKRFFQLP